LDKDNFYTKLIQALLHSDFRFRAKDLSEEEVLKDRDKLSASIRMAAKLAPSIVRAITGENLTKGITDLHPAFDQKRTATITYSPPEEISLNLNNGMKLLITFSWTLPGFPTTTEAKITQKAYFKLVSQQERPLSDFISTAYKLPRYYALL